MKKVLILKMTAIGDVITAIPQIERIAAYHANDTVWVLTASDTADLFASHPVLKTAILHKNSIFQGKWGRIFWARRQRFDIVYDLQGNRFSRRVVQYSNAAIRVGTQPVKIYTHHPENIYDKNSKQNVFDRLNETIQSYGLTPAFSAGPIYTSKNQQERVARFKSENGLQEGAYAIFHAGSSRGWLTKRWPEARYATLAVAIERSGCRVVWVGGQEDRELNTRLSREAGVNATGAFTLSELHWLGKGARFSLVNDSAPMHLLATAGIPVFAFFGPTDWRRSHAVGQQKRIFSANVDCSPCYLGKCPKSKRHVCMESITAESVFERIDQAVGLT